MSSQSLYDCMENRYHAMRVRVATYHSHISNELWRGVKASLHELVSDEAMTHINLDRHRERFAILMAADSRLCEIVDRQEGLRERARLDLLHHDCEWPLRYEIMSLPEGTIGSKQVDMIEWLSHHRFARHARLRRQFRLCVDTAYYAFADATDQHYEKSEWFERTATQVTSKLEAFYPHVVMR